MGASHTFRISDGQSDGGAFSRRSGRIHPYIMEEYINGEVNSYDAIIDSQGNPLFETEM